MSDHAGHAAPGWDAIDRALAELYGEREPDRHYGTIVRWAQGGQDPLDGLSAYKVLEPRPHWHLVSYGMTELYAKESENPDESGWGFEFVMRVACPPDAEDPPAWTLDFLQNIGRYVFSSGNWFEAGHHMSLNGPIAMGQDTRIHAIAFAPAPRLSGRIESPNGAFEFLHVVGITLDELEATQRWTTDGVLELMRGEDPLLVTDLARDSVLDDPELARRYEEGRRRDGSSQGAVNVDALQWTRDGDAVRIQIGALAVRGLRHIVEGRLPFGRAGYIRGPDGTVVFQPSDTFATALDEDGDLVVRLPAPAAAALAALPAERGVYRWPGLPGLEVTVLPSEVTDREGNVVETIG